ncbi:MAG: hypothetical protein COU42_00630 [Candidatus Nealsonbacteria bacterium CG10_big_fil_rev_8_21_14_0_10_36_24]|uniref:SHSP domain-containing protein n=2 Tax=Candidatus Nealsoniibacteriota TaxID=1817911 RepID=A0A2H0YN65_9BACT|nr:MAG: hypothetical protein COU42_00630 [Candidatus Nealsonbacteria bacterium CG10_big_fil_rev_8_21_14_0_10_36_24]PIS39944.1 MAG: hypothetical protein COT32_02345 [Candidatus Nealsonbacteria bacterium CG08_land_8_20_14_0_20_36_22]
MSNFFEKLKKGMVLEETPEKEVAKEEKKPRKKLKKEPNKEPEKEPKKEKIKVEKELSKKDFAKKENFSIANLGEPEGELTIDVFETNEDIIIQSAIAGVEPENLDITVENDMVTIKGSRGKQLIQETQNYFRQECFWGKFSKEIILPVETDNSRAKAIIKNGILTIKIPKIKKVKIKKLVVEE